MGTKEDDERWGAAIEAIDEGLESEDLNERLQASIAWALTDIADSLDVLAQYVESGAARGVRGARKTAKKARRPAREPIEIEEEDTDDD